MEKLNLEEMSSILAAACSWIKKLAKAAKGDHQLALIDKWQTCKNS